MYNGLALPVTFSLAHGSAGGSERAAVTLIIITRAEGEESLFPGPLFEMTHMTHYTKLEKGSKIVCGGLGAK
jgi:hypothetical protein